MLTIAKFINLFFLCFSLGASAYPAHWWKAVEKKGAPDWEILPQAAQKGEVILSKRNELGLLSNFAPTPFVFRGKRFASLEGFWQAMLFPEDANDPRAIFPGLKWAHTRDQVAAMASFEAKTAGEAAFENMKRMKINWVTYDKKRLEYWTAQKGEHYALIVEAMREKVRQNPKVKEVLLATRGLKLRPDHLQEKDAPPSWHYFEILTNLREELGENTDGKH